MAGPRPGPGRAAGQQDAPAARVARRDVARLMSAACRHQGVPAEQIDAVVAHYLEGELRGKPSHGVAKFCFESQFFHLRQGPPEVVHQRGVFAVVDAHREIGPLSAAFAVDLAVATAARHGAAAVGMINTQRYGILAPWTEEIARHGLIGIATNTSRAEAVPAGGRTPVLGVNPTHFPAQGRH
ncbi:MULTISPECIES: Ldh family oxidoreductase [unclassified Frankia]|uniref:Ldh family oxidoreductase n=1 Tax=unclassified Frankia TaxID=2632575 RepID=UPI002105B4D1|nr:MULTISPECIES: Ldh family oxidoreductase [unclassified Frankia]